jgi:GNAT superfamily N-acetyltransferase
VVATGDDGRPVGFAVFALHEGEAHLEEIDVGPEHAGHGVGRRLIQAVVAQAREAGLRAWLAFARRNGATAPSSLPAWP